MGKNNKNKHAYRKAQAERRKEKVRQGIPISTKDDERSSTSNRTFARRRGPGKALRAKLAAEAAAAEAEADNVEGGAVDEVDDEDGDEVGGDAEVREEDEVGETERIPGDDERAPINIESDDENVPPQPIQFVQPPEMAFGMDDELAVLEETLIPTGTILIVNGGPGSGKKTLAREFAHCCGPKFDVVLEIDSPATMAGAIAALGLPVGYSLNLWLAAPYIDGKLAKWLLILHEPRNVVFGDVIRSRGSILITSKTRWGDDDLPRVHMSGLDHALARRIHQRYLPLSANVPGNARLFEIAHGNPRLIHSLCRVSRDARVTALELKGIYDGQRHHLHNFMVVNYPGWFLNPSLPPIGRLTCYVVQRFSQTVVVTADYGHAAIGQAFFRQAYGVVVDPGYITGLTMSHRNPSENFNEWRVFNRVMDKDTQNDRGHTILIIRGLDGLGIDIRHWSQFVKEARDNGIDLYICFYCDKAGGFSRVIPLREFDSEGDHMEDVAVLLDLWQKMAAVRLPPGQNPIMTTPEGSKWAESYKKFGTSGRNGDKALNYLIY
jgi:hypothetical protein